MKARDDSTGLQSQLPIPLLGAPRKEMGTGGVAVSECNIYMHEMAENAGGCH